MVAQRRPASIQRKEIRNFLAAARVSEHGRPTTNTLAQRRHEIHEEQPRRCKARPASLSAHGCSVLG
ncbi:hypothetical protein A2U01_0061050, partial [Trifolium medium]|nr:hypothetical protein [Trifolium medium]